MRVEVAVVKMIEAARQKDVAPEKLAKAFELALEKVASLTPVGDQALKIVQTHFIKELLKNELNVVARIAKGPRKPRQVKTETTTEKSLVDEISDAFSKELETVAEKPRRKTKAAVAA